MTILKDQDVPRFTIRVDGENIEGEFFLVSFCNGAREGGGFIMAPEAALDDGELDYIMVDSVSRPMMFRLLPELMRGAHLRFKQVHSGRFRKLELTSDRPLLIHTDGEIYANAATNVRELTVEVLPEAIHLIA
jgi:diacylglycerol kinase family enzyme